MAVHKVEPKIVSQESYKAEANTTAVNYKSINPFSKETQQPAPKKVVSSALFANVDDAYVKNTPKTKTPAPALGGLFNGGKSLTQPTVEVGKVAPLPSDVEEKRAAEFRKAFDKHDSAKNANRPDTQRSGFDNGNRSSLSKSKIQRDSRYD